jgi:hypothetical protein
MGLVHGDQADTGAFQHAVGARRRQPFRRDVQELQPPLLQRLPDGIGFLGRVAGGQRARLDPGLAQAAHLVAHQRDERRDHHRHAIAHERGQLEAQRLAAPGRHDGQHVLPRRDGAHDLRLAGTEPVESEDGGKERRGVRAGLLHGGGLSGLRVMLDLP